MKKKGSDSTEPLSKPASHSTSNNSKSSNMDQHELEARLDSLVVPQNKPKLGESEISEEKQDVIPESHSEDKEEALPAPEPLKKKKRKKKKKGGSRPQTNQ